MVDEPEEALDYLLTELRGKGGSSLADEIERAISRGVHIPAEVEH